ncbi:hypothetical protein [Actinoplanes utahensis]|uniref:Uncharacterized protein n=1 Tax=Actinoplanes utahensis TaxID=1869 RepID=A0A0A6ULJ4_ACTUT|nr:hypothetical protein [Actinoplanes utahensis]KHD75938.1 hypothetical protein MB27_20030 [Actinoplanes utahensis]GIF35040.1 hypothetical protein Aut01nite_80260 [Actinoplanes utahensis]
MAGSALYAELAAVRTTAADALAGIGAAGDTGQVWVRSACARLAAFDSTLTEAAGVLPAPVRVITVSLVTFLVVFGSAALAGATGLGSAGVLAVTGAALPAALGLSLWAARPVRSTVGRRRLARAARSRPPTSVPIPDGPASMSPAPSGAEADSASPAERLTTVADELSRARVRLVSAAMRQAGSANWTVPRLRRSLRTDPVVGRLAAADQLLCQAIDCVERHLDDLRKDPA